MNCQTCNAKIPTMARRLMRVNSELHQLGLEYHQTLGYSVDAVDRILVKHGFNVIEGQVLVSPSGKHHCEVGEGRWLTLSYHRMPSGRYEIVAYVN